MSTFELTVRLLAGVLLTAVNAFFVVTEFALTRLRQFDEADFNTSALRQAWKMTERLEFYLTGCQLGITSSSILLGVIAEPAVSALVRPFVDVVGVSASVVPTVSVVVSVIVINLLHKVWGEQAPTYVGVERPLQVAEYTALPHLWWCRVTKPAILLGDGLAKMTLRLFGIEMSRSWTKKKAAGPTSENSEDASGEIVSAGSYTSDRATLVREMGELLTRGHVPCDRVEEVLSALKIDEIPVRDIMVPRDDIIALRTHLSLRENIRRMSNPRRLTRFPMFGSDESNLLGVVYISDVFQKLPSLRSGKLRLSDLATPPLIVDGSLPVSHLIDRFQEGTQELAIVQDSEQHVLGLVTVTEALEAIAGEIDDPFDLAELPTSSDR